MSDIDDPSTPRFFSKQKSEIDDILSDIDNDLSDDVMDMESFDDAPAEPLKASKPFGGSKKSSFGGSFGKSNFIGGLSSSRQSSSSKLLAGTVLALLVVGGAGGAYYYFTQDNAYSSSPQIAAPLAPPPSAPDMAASPQDMAVPTPPPSIDGTMPAMPVVNGAAPPSPDMAVDANANIPALPNQEGVTPPAATPDVNAPSQDLLAQDSLPKDSLVPQIASDVTPPVPVPAAAPVDPNAPKADVTTNAPVNTTTPPKKDDNAATASANNATTATATAPSAPVAAPDTPVAPSADSTPKVDITTDSASKVDPSKTELMAESKTDKVTKPSTKPEKIKYFDSPAGEVLEDIQPPSIDVTRNPGESIIIVKKPVGYDRGYADGVYSNTGDGSVKIERSEVTGALAQKAVMADRALRLGRYDMALSYYHDILAQNPNDVTALLGRAISLQKSGNADAALEGYRDVLRRDPSNVTAATNMAGLQSGSSPDSALKNLSNVYQSDPNNVSVKAQMGVSMAQSGNVDDAYNVFLSATKSEPRNPVHFYNLAVTAEKLGKTSEAIAAYEKCLEVDAIYGTGRSINRDAIYDRLSQIRK